MIPYRLLVGLGSILERFPHAMMQMFPQYFVVRLFQDRRGGLQLVRNVDAIPVFFYHTENAVYLPAGRLEEFRDFIGIGYHLTTA